MNMSFRQGIQWVIDNCTSYQVAKDLKINPRTINRYQNGETPLENMTLGTAEKVYNYYLKELDAMEREELFSRGLAVLNKIGMRRFEKRKPNIEKTYLMELEQKPMTIYYRAYKDVMQYAAHFDSYDLALLEHLTNYTASLDGNGFTDEPLSPKALIYFSKEMVALQNKEE